jgi:NAD(P)H-hydrate epimerase
LTASRTSPYHRDVQPIISVAQMREIDRLTTERYGVASLTLMENAASATAKLVIEILSGDISGRSILVFCAKGNNGGDGAAASRLLATAGACVDVVLIGNIDETTGDARTNFERLRTWKDERAAREAKPDAVADVGVLNFFECESEPGWQQLLASTLTTPRDAVVDAIFGTGLTRAASGLHREAIRYLNRIHDAGTPVISIDIPSGLNSDSEAPVGEAVNATATVTMTAPKRANALPPAAHFNGKLDVAEIGSPHELIDEANSQLFLVEARDARDWLRQTRYTPESFKNTHGHALIIAGSRGFTGAAVLCGNAAMKAGAGLVTVATPASSQPLVATQAMPEVMTTAIAETDRGAVSDEGINNVGKFAERANVVAIGPGLSSEDERTRSFVRAVIEKRRTAVIIDADGLNCLSPWPSALRGSADLPIILTPHPGEMLRLMGTEDKSVLKDRVTAARDFAAAHDVILVLKGSRTLIAAPDGRVFINSTGNAGLGTAGAGDTLTGVIAGFVAQAFGTLKADADTLEAVLAAVYTSGLAGDLAARKLGMRGMTASDIREHLSEAFRLLDPLGETPIVASL